MERFWSNSIFRYLRVEPEDHYFLLTEPVSCPRSLFSLVDRRDLMDPLNLAPESAREPREHGGDHVRIIQLRRFVYRRSGRLSPGRILVSIPTLGSFFNRHRHRFRRWSYSCHSRSRRVRDWVINQIHPYRWKRHNLLRSISST